MPKYLSQVVCSLHPDLNGLRWVGNRKCVKCDAERAKQAQRKRRLNTDRRAIDNAKAAIARREKYRSDPAFAEAERARCREAQRARRAAAKASPVVRPGG